MILSEHVIKKWEKEAKLRIINGDVKGIYIPIVISVLTDGVKTYDSYKLSPGNSIVALTETRFYLTASSSIIILPSRESMLAGLYINEVIQSNHAGSFDVHVRNLGRTTVTIKRGDVIGYAIILESEHGWGDYKFFLEVFQGLLNRMLNQYMLPFEFKEYYIPKFSMLRKLVRFDDIMEGITEIFDKLSLSPEDKLINIVSMVVSNILSNSYEEILVPISQHELRELNRIILEEIYPNFKDEIKLDEENVKWIIKSSILVYLLPQIMYKAYLAVKEYEEHSDEMLYILKFFDDMSADMQEWINRILRKMPFYEKDRELILNAIKVLTFIISAYHILRATDGLYNASYEDALILYQTGKRYLMR